MTQIARVTRRRWVGRLVTAILVLFDRRLLDLLLGARAPSLTTFTELRPAT